MGISARAQLQNPPKNETDSLDYAKKNPEKYYQPNRTGPVYRFLVGVPAVPMIRGAATGLNLGLYAEGYAGGGIVGFLTNEKETCQATIKSTVGVLFSGLGGYEGVRAVGDITVRLNGVGLEENGYGYMIELARRQFNDGSHSRSSLLGVGIHHGSSLVRNPGDHYEAIFVRPLQRIGQENPMDPNDPEHNQGVGGLCWVPAVVIVGKRQLNQHVTASVEAEFSKFDYSKKGTFANDRRQWIGLEGGIQYNPVKKKRPLVAGTFQYMGSALPFRAAGTNVYTRRKTRSLLYGVEIYFPF